MPRPREAIITLLTDFGTADAYVAAMKGVILSINPRATVVDLTHDIPAQDIRSGALTLLSACSYYPPGTIHVAVVDPGVGSPRRPLACRSSRYFFVGPDNGILWPVLERDGLEEAFELSEPRYQLEWPSATFHGRDIFAPAAAHLSLGVRPERFGPPVPDPVRLWLPRAERGPKGVAGEIIHVDRFGNLVTNVRREDLAGSPAESVACRAGRVLLKGLCRTYADVEPGAPLMLIGSLGFLEIAVNGGSGAAELGLDIGDRVMVECVARR